MPYSGLQMLDVLSPVFLWSCCLRRSRHSSCKPVYALSKVSTLGVFYSMKSVLGQWVNIDTMKFFQSTSTSLGGSV